MITSLTNVTIYFYLNGKKHRYTSTWKEYIELYKREIKERYGANTKIEIVYN